MSGKSNELLNRRGFVKRVALALAAAGTTFFGVGCVNEGSERSAPENFVQATTLENPSLAAPPPLPPLPPASPNPEEQFGVDLNINIENIDDYLNRDDVIYRDMRLYRDPANFGAIGGDPNLPDVLEGFKITPLPYLASLSPLPVEGRYDSSRLLEVTRDEENNILEVQENYLESMMIINDLFPKDMPIFLVCGGGGYAAEMKALLIYLGWDADKLYLIGPMWGYKGNRVVELIKYPDNPGEDNICMLWRADYAVIDFDLMHKLV
jgi:hypothetical protein